MTKSAEIRAVAGQPHAVPEAGPDLRQTTISVDGPSVSQR